MQKIDKNTDDLAVRVYKALKISDFSLSKSAMRISLIKFKFNGSFFCKKVPMQCVFKHPLNPWTGLKNFFKTFFWEREKEGAEIIIKMHFRGLG